MEQYDSSVEKSSKVSEQQQRNDEQQRPSCAAELTEASSSVAEMRLCRACLKQNKNVENVEISHRAKYCECHTTSSLVANVLMPRAFV